MIDYTALFAEHNLPAPTPEQAEQLSAYEALLLKWNKAINLIGRSTTQDVATRHLLDSAQITGLLPEGTKTLLDVGAGAGLPSVIIAILRPEITVQACEINGKKASFINTVRRTLGLTNLMTLNEDIKALDLPPQDVITARAFAALKDILNWTSPYANSSTTYVLPKGNHWQDEVDDAADEISTMTVETFSSITTDRQNKGGQILVLTPQGK